MMLRRRWSTAGSLLVLSLVSGASDPSCNPCADEPNLPDLGTVKYAPERWKQCQAVEDVFRKAMRQPKSPVPIVYDERLKPWPLTQGQLNTILRRADEVRPEGQRTWFILVRNCYAYDCEFHYSATIYYEPYATTERVRKGWCTGYGHMGWRFQRRIRKLGAQPATYDRNSPSYWKHQIVSGYWQVPLADERSTDVLKAPAKTLWPFDPPKGFSEQEAVEIIDFVRTSPKMSMPGAGGDALSDTMTTRIPG